MGYKFRGKRLDGQGWVYGWSLGPNLIIPLDTKYTNTSMGLILHDYYEVLPESVGQWTGLVDGHGKEIYEGDILRATPNGEEHIGVVEYDVGEAQWFGAKDFLGYAVAYSGAEIIGNIHDKICDYKNTGCGNCEVPNELRRCNPELMEVE
jgi:hypothetical protein